MTTDDIAEYYANLLIIQYRNKPKAAAMMKALVKPVLIDQMPVAVMNAFDIDGAVGVQLDTLGKYIGISRTGYALGEPIVLDDDDYRTLIKLILLKNNSGTSLATIQSLLADSFPGQIFISDSQNMSLNYVILESLGTSTLLNMLATQDLLPRPMGVGTSITIVASHTNPFFGFRTYDAPDPSVSPFNNYDFYQTVYPWLTYDS